MDSRKGFARATRVSRIALQILGVWPDLHAGNKNCLLRHYFIFPILIMVYFINIPQTTILKYIWTDLNEVLDVLTTANITVFIAVVKLLGIWYNSEVLHSLVTSMDNDWKKAQNKLNLYILWKNAKLSNWISIIIISLAAGTVTVYLAMNIYLNNIEPVQYSLSIYNESKRIRRLYLKSRFIHDVQKSPYYEIVWIFQCCATFLAGLSFSSIDAFFAVLVLHVCSQLNILRTQLDNCFKNVQSDRYFSQMIAKIVLRYDDLSKFAKSVEEAFNLIFLVQMVISAIVLCFQGYQLIAILDNEKSIEVLKLIFMLYYCLCVNFSLFIYCYVAETLRFESMEMGYAIYKSPWYCLPASQTRLLILIMIRAKTPFEITAGKFAAFSLQLYCSVLKSSGGYLSMLLAVKNRLAN